MHLSCPVCGNKLVEMGYPDELGFQSYRCPNDCQFEPPFSWKLWNAIGFVILFLFMIICIIAFSPYIFFDRIVSRGVKH